MHLRELMPSKGCPAMLASRNLLWLQNHCCAPCLYTKIVEVDGMSRLVFFARATIRPGQELTYDYR